MENIRSLSSGIVFNVLLCCVFFLVLIFLSLDQFTTMDFNFLVILDGLFIYLFICYVYCYFSENITTKSFEIGDIVYNSLWYEMSTKEKKAIVLMIQRSQKEFRLTGLGLVDCSLGQFLSVTIGFLHIRFLTKTNNFQLFQIVKSSHSYFLVFRKL